MALQLFVVTADVTIPAGTATAITDGFGTVSWAGASGAYGAPEAVTLQAGQLVWADSAAGSDGPQLLYQAIGAGNLRVATDTDKAHGGHYGISN